MGHHKLVDTWHAQLAINLGFLETAYPGAED
jgi:hypothetical protein